MIYVHPPSNKYLRKLLRKSGFSSMCLEFVGFFFHGDRYVEMICWQRLLGDPATGVYTK